MTRSMQWLVARSSEDIHAILCSIKIKEDIAAIEPDLPMQLSSAKKAKLGIKIGEQISMEINMHFPRLTKGMS